jgi:hypothetical protein
MASSLAKTVVALGGRHSSQLSAAGAFLPSLTTERVRPLLFSEPQINSLGKPRSGRLSYQCFGSLWDDCELCRTMDSLVLAEG